MLKDMWKIVENLLTNPGANPKLFFVKLDHKLLIIK